jgi:hypothetical protein
MRGGARDKARAGVACEACGGAGDGRWQVVAARLCSMREHPAPEPEQGDLLRIVTVGTRPIVALASLVTLAACGSLGSTLPSGCTKSAALTVGDTIRASLGPASCQETDGTYVDFYDLVLPSQLNLVVSASSPGANTYLQLYDQRRAIVVNSAVFQTPDSIPRVRVIVGSGSYQFAVHGTVAGQTAAYRLIATPDTAPVAGCAAVWVTPGVQTTQTLASTDCTQGSGSATHFYHVYEIVMLFSQAVTFTEQSSAFNPSMSLFQATTGGSVNSTLSSDSATATINSFATASDGYQLWVGTLKPLQTGTYTLTTK